MDRDWLKVKNYFTEKLQYYFPCLKEVRCGLIKLLLISQISTYLTTIASFAQLLYLYVNPKQQAVRVKILFILHGLIYYTCLLYMFSIIPGNK